jgi:hypothetical protein
VTWADRVRRKLCCRKGCSAKRCAGSNYYCAPHWEDQKRRALASARRRKAWLARQMPLVIAEASLVLAQGDAEWSQCWTDEPLSTDTANPDSD